MFAVHVGPAYSWLLLNATVQLLPFQIGQYSNVPFTGRSRWTAGPRGCLEKSALPSTVLHLALTQDTVYLRSPE